MRLLLTVISLVLVLPKAGFAQEAKQIAPLELRLIPLRTVYPKGETAKEQFVAIKVELRNVGSEKLDLHLAPEPVLELTGPRPNSASKAGGVHYYVNQEHDLALAPGQVRHVTLHVLAYRAGNAQFHVQWHEPGTYTLQATYVIQQKGKGPANTLTVKSEPVKLTIEERPVADFWADALTDKDDTFRSIALANLKTMGPAAKSAGAALALLLRDRDPARRVQAADTLAAIGPASKEASLKALRACLADEDATVRRAVIKALSRVGPAEKPVAPAIVPFLRDPDAKTRSAAAEALHFMPFNQRAVEPFVTTALLRALKTEKVPEAKHSLIAALCHHPGLEVLDALAPCLADDDKHVRFETIHTLSRMVPFMERDKKKNEALGRPIEKTVTALAGLLADPEFTANAAHALGYFGADGAPAVPALLDALDDPRHQSKEAFASPRVNIVQALRGIGPAAKAATRALALRLLTDPDYSVRQYCAQALGAIGPEASAAAGAALNQAFKDKMVQVRNEVAPALAKIGDVEALVDGLNDDDSETRRSVIQALGTMKDRAKEVLPALVKSLHTDKHAANRRTAAYALGSLAVPTASDDLVRALKDNDPEVRAAAVDGLRNVGAHARQAIEPLFQVMQGEKVEATRVKAGWALATINVKGEKSLVAPLVKLLNDSNKEVVLPGIYLLGQLGRDAEPALPRLREIVDTQQNPHADAARIAMRQIMSESIRDK